MPAMLICPICLSEFPRTAMQWRNSAGAPAQPIPLKVTGLRGFVRRSVDPPDERASMRAAADAVADGLHPVCPLGHELPPDFHTRQTVIIGLVGERGTSKSHYLAVLIHLLDSGVLTRYNLTAQLLPSSARRYTQLYRPLLDNPHRQLETTQLLSAGESQEPLVLILRDMRHNTAVNVAFYDASGEQQMTARDQASLNRFLCVASGLLLFVAPAALERVRDHLPPEAMHQTSIATGAMFEQTAELLRQARRLPGTADLPDVAVAVLLTKADQLLGMPDFDKNWVNDLDYESLTLAEVLEQVADESDDISQYMAQSGAVNLVANVTNRFDRATFHAISATGCDADAGLFPFVHPMRCLDPILYLLARAGVLQVKGGVG